MKKLKTLTFILTYILTTLFLSTAGATKTSYRISVEFSIDNQPKKEMSIVVLEGEKGFIETQLNNESTFLEVLAKKRSFNKNKAIQMDFKVGQKMNDGTSKILSTPQIITELGEETLIVIGQKNKEELRFKATAIEL